MADLIVATALAPRERPGRRHVLTGLASTLSAIAGIALSILFASCIRRRGQPAAWCHETSPMPAQPVSDLHGDSSAALQRAVPAASSVGSV